MINNDEALIQTRHLVLEETCRLAWNDQLDEEHKEEMVYKIIPGPKPAIGRCCIYKRERDCAPPDETCLRRESVGKSGFQE